jgi:hypothetical protein
MRLALRLWLITSATLASVLVFTPRAWAQG